MSKTKKINAIVFSIIIFFSIIFFLPQLLSPQFNLIDDGYSLQIAQDLAKHPRDLSEILVTREIELGRMRFIYYIYYFLLYLIAGANPLVFWIGQTLSLGITVYLVYLIINHLLKKPVLSLLSSLPIFLLPSVVENFLRLGPAESRQMIWVLLGVLFFFKLISKNKNSPRSIFGLFLLWLIPIFIKETSFIFLGLYGLVFAFLAAFKIKKAWLLSLFSFLLLTIIIFILPKGQAGYTSALTLDLGSVKNNLFIARISMPEFWWLFMVSSGILVLNIFRAIPLTTKKIKLKLAKKLFIFGAAFGNLLLPLFWTYQLERYYYPAQIFVLILLVTETHEFFTWIDLKNKKHYPSLLMVSFLIVILSLFVFIPSTLSTKKFASKYLAHRKSWYEEYQYNGAMVEYLMQENFSRFNIFVTYNDYEIIQEIGLYASKFNLNDESLTIFNKNQGVEKKFGPPFVFVKNPKSEFLLSKDPAILIEKGDFDSNSTVLWPANNSLNNREQAWGVRRSSP